MSTIVKRIADIHEWRTAALARRGDVALAVFEGIEGAPSELAKLDSEIAAADRQLGTLRAAQDAAERRDAEAAEAAANAALADVRQRVDLLVADRLLKLGDLVEAIRGAEAAYDAVRDGIAPLARELAKLGIRAGDGSALILGEIGRRLERLLRQRFGRFDELTGVRRTGRAVSDADFADWLAIEVRLLKTQVLLPAMAGSGDGDGE